MAQRSPAVRHTPLEQQQAPLPFWPAWYLTGDSPVLYGEAGQIFTFLALLTGGGQQALKYRGPELYSGGKNPMRSSTGVKGGQQVDMEVDVAVAHRAL